MLAGDSDEVSFYSKCLCVQHTFFLCPAELQRVNYFLVYLQLSFEGCPLFSNPDRLYPSLCLFTSLFIQVFLMESTVTTSLFSFINFLSLFLGFYKGFLAVSRRSVTQSKKLQTGKVRAFILISSQYFRRKNPFLNCLFESSVWTKCVWDGGKFIYTCILNCLM